MKRGVHSGVPASAPHRISLRLPARLLRLPLLGARASRPHPEPADPDPGANHKHPLHHKPETGFTSCQAMGQGASYWTSRITPPWRGSRREGEARSRAGGGQPRRPVSDYTKVETAEGSRRPVAVGVSRHCGHEPECGPRQARTSRTTLGSKLKVIFSSSPLRSKKSSWWCRPSWCRMVACRSSMLTGFSTAR